MAKKKTYSETVIEAFLKYDKIIDIVRATKLSRGTIDKYRKDEEFQKVLSERKAIFVEAAVTNMCYTPFMGNHRAKGGYPLFRRV